MSASITVTVPRGIRLSANDRPGHWAVRARATRDLRSLAAAAWRAAGHQPISTAELHVAVGWARLARRRDAHNLAPTIKALVDGLVDAGALPDDDDTHLTATHITTDDTVAPDGAVVITLTLRRPA